jgi:hypothetical protein
VGIVAAIIGLALYATFEIMTGITIGYLSLAVGFLIGRAMMFASKGAGGRRYQIAAILLTYCAVSLAAIPVALSQFKDKRQEHRQAQAKSGGQTTGEQNQAGTQSSSAGEQGTSQPETTSDQPKSQMSMGAIWGYLILIGLASPFLELQEPLSGLIGLVILFVGMRIAWRTTAGIPTQVDGPYDNTATTPA